MQSIVLRALPYEPQPYPTQLPRTGESQWTGAGVGAELWDKMLLFRIHMPVLPPPPPGRLDLPRSATWHPGPVLR